jgi:hypothetical protein
MERRRFCDLASELGYHFGLLGKTLAICNARFYFLMMYIRTVREP